MGEHDTPRVTVQKNGPLRVTDLQRFSNSRGESIGTRQTIALCRCGASRTKPFCDGSHATVGFDDAKRDDRVPDNLDRYAGRQVTVLDNRGTCSHAGFCTSGLPQVWRMGVEPWIDPDGAPPDDVQRVIRQCPSGALAWEEAGVRHDRFLDEPEIQVSRDGPYRVRGGVLLEHVAFGEGASREHFALCRCGHSRNKPFCDGSHWYVGFKDDEALTIARANAEPSGDGITWMSVGRADALAKDRVNTVQAGSKTLALAYGAGGWCAIDGLCPHQGGPLTEGTVCDGAIRCPWHGYDFDLATGKGRGNAHTVTTFEVREVEGTIEVASPAPSRARWTVGHVVAARGVGGRHRLRDGRAFEPRHGRGPPRPGERCRCFGLFRFALVCSGRQPRGFGLLRSVLVCSCAECLIVSQPTPGTRSAALYRGRAPATMTL